MSLDAQIYERLYQPCTACERSAIDWYRGIGATPGWRPATVGCADGPDGLCTPHRSAIEWERTRPEREQKWAHEHAEEARAREARRKAKWMKRWTTMLPEGQE